MLALQPHRNLLHLRLRLRGRHATAQAGDDLSVVVLADGTLRVGIGQWDPHVRTRRTPGPDGEALRHHADDLIGLAVKHQGAADDIWSPAELPFPEAIAQHDDAIAAGGVFSCIEYA